MSSKSTTFTKQRKAAQKAKALGRINHEIVKVTL
jgi:hypothetical protein